MASAPSKLYSGELISSRTANSSLSSTDFVLCVPFFKSRFRRRCQPRRCSSRRQSFLLGRGRRCWRWKPPRRCSHLCEISRPCQVIPFLNSLLLMNQLNQVVLIATGINSCGYIYDSGSSPDVSDKVSEVSSEVLRRLEEFVYKDRKVVKGAESAMGSNVTSLLSGSLSLALCYIQKVFRSGAIHPQPRILCLQASPDGPEQYVAVMNAIFSAQRSMVPIDSCVVGVQHSAFLQQASYITGGIYLKPPQLDGLFQYLAAVFATDLQSRGFLQLPKPTGVDFRASCFCHKKTIDMGYVCSICLSIFCQHHRKCSTCGSEFNQTPLPTNSASDTMRAMCFPNQA